MITLKEAVANAREYFQNIYPDAEKGLVEEVEMDEAEQFWFITLSYAESDGKLSLVAGANPWESPVIFSPKLDRTYKSFKINAETGRVVSMKIRVLSA